MRREGKPRVSYVPGWNDLKATVRESVRPGDVVITLGAGNIYKLGEELLGEKEAVRKR